MKKSIRDLTDHPCAYFLSIQIRYFRKKSGLTQKELSELSEIKLRHLQKIEAGDVDIKLSTLGSLSRGLGITPHELLYPATANIKLLCEQCRKNSRLLIKGFKN